MIQKLKKKLKDQKGFTLIELLAVIVILGIIAAIAVPSILGIINHSKQDAHIANAQQIANVAKIYISDEKVTATVAAAGISAQTLIDKGYLDTLDDPSGNNYNLANSKVLVTRVVTSAADATEKTYKNVYKIYLTAGTDKDYIGTAATDTGAVDVSTLKREMVTLP